MVTIMVTKRPWTILIQHVVQSNISSVVVVVGGGGVALRIKITCNHYTKRPCIPIAQIISFLEIRYTWLNAVFKIWWQGEYMCNT